MKRANRVAYREDIPEGVVRVAIKRTEPLMRHWAHRLPLINLDILLASCYLQGVEDCVQTMSREPPPPLDYQI